MRSRNAGFARRRSRFRMPAADTADVLRRFEGAIERTFGVAASPALGTLRNFEIRKSATRNTRCTKAGQAYFLVLHGYVISLLPLGARDAR